ncbi:hypothetical protein V8C43DRAFT_304830 [Trichoderma afarasin]
MRSFLKPYLFVPLLLILLLGGLGILHGRPIGDGSISQRLQIRQLLRGDNNTTTTTTTTNTTTWIVQSTTFGGKSKQGENGQECRALLDYNCRPTSDLRCGYGETLAGWDRDGCKENEGKPICCPTDTAPEKCVWRGSGNDGGIWGDCNGQCHNGEAMVLSSKWGGGPEKDRESDPYKCARGHKVFCCEAGSWTAVTDGCYWTECTSGGSCKSGTKELAVKKGDCTSFRVNQYCCPDDTPLHDCTWRGSAPDCVDTNCKMQDNDKVLAEVQVDTHQRGGSWSWCNWGRKRSMCCQVSKAPIPPPTCGITTCDLEPLACNEDSWEDPEDDWLEPEDSELSVDAGDGNDDDGSVSVLEKRGGARRYQWYTTAGRWLEQRSRPDPGRSGYMRNIRNEVEGVATTWWQRRSQNCDGPVVSRQDLDRDGSAPEDSHIEHLLPAILISRFAAVANHGRHWAPRRVASRRRDGRIMAGQLTPEGPPTRTPPITSSIFWHEVWNNATGLPAGLPGVTPNSPEMRRPVDRLYEAIGSTTNPRNFLLLQDNINLMKGRIEVFRSPMTARDYMTSVMSAVNPSESDPEAQTRNFMAPLRELQGVFEYLRDTDAVTREDDVATRVRNQTQIIELHRPDAAGLPAHWDEFYANYMMQVSEFARTWGTNNIRYAISMFESHPRAFNRDEVLKLLRKIKETIPDWKYPFEDDEEFMSRVFERGKCPKRSNTMDGWWMEE